MMDKDFHYLADLMGHIVGIAVRLSVP